MKFSARAFATTLLCASLLSGCFNTSEKQEWQVEPEGVQSNFPMPQKVLKKVDAGSVTASVKIDEGAWQTLTVNNGMASGSIKGIAKGAHTITVRFSYSLPEGGSLVLTQVAESITIVAGGSNRLSINEDKYDFSSFDDDKDGVPNADEVSQGTNPKDATDFIPPPGTSSAQPASSITAVPSSSSVAASSDVAEASSSSTASTPLPSSASDSSLMATSSSASSIIPVVPASSAVAVSSVSVTPSSAALSSLAAVSSEGAASTVSSAAASSTAVPQSSSSTATESSRSATLSSSSIPASSASVASSSSSSMPASSASVASSSVATTPSSAVASSTITSSSALSSALSSAAISSSISAASSSISVMSSSAAVSSSSVATTPSSAVSSSASTLSSSSKASSSSAVNLAPTAIITPLMGNSVAEGSLVTLSGSTSTDDVTPSKNLSYAWTQVTPAIDLGLTGAALSQSSLSFKAPNLTSNLTATFTLVVTDEQNLASAPVSYSVTITAVNEAPVVKAPAGTVNAAFGMPFNLGMTVTDGDSQTLQYAWAADNSLAQSALSSLTIATPTFTPPKFAVDTLVTFTLTVTDGGEATRSALENATAIASVKVLIAANNAPPVAVISNAAGTALTGTATLLETEYGASTPSSLELHAKTSSDDFNSPLKYQWTIVSDTLSLKDLGLTSADLTAETLTIKAPNLTASVDLAVSLVVTEDRMGGYASKAATLSVQIKANNDAPIAIAGYSLAGVATNAETMAVKVAQNITLDGSLSRDGDDGITSHVWSIADNGGTAVAFSAMPVGASQSLVVPNAPAGAKIVLRLTVTDVSGQSTTDDLTLLVDPSDTALPVASATIVTTPITEGSEGNVIRSTSTDDTGIATYKWTSKDPAITFTSDDRKDGVFSVAELVLNPPKTQFVVTLDVTDLAGKKASKDITVTVTLKLEPRSFNLKDANDQILAGKESVAYVGGRTLNIKVDGIVGSGALTFTSSTTGVATVVKGMGNDAVVTSGNTVGTTTITATQASNGVYAQAVQSFTFKTQALKSQVALQIAGSGFTLANLKSYTGGAKVTLTTTGGSGSGAVTYTSSDTTNKVLTIDSATGVVTPGTTAGTAIITATKAANGDYLAATATYSFVVTQRLANTMFFENAKDGTKITAISCAANCAATSIIMKGYKLGGGTGGQFTFTSSNPSVVSVVGKADGTAQLTGLTGGQSTITAKRSADDVYEEVSVSFIYTVLKSNLLVIKNADTNELPAASVNVGKTLNIKVDGYSEGGGAGGLFNITLNNPSVARLTYTLGAKTATLEFIGLGTATVTASRTADDAYASVEKTYTFTTKLLKPQKVAFVNLYLAELVVGDTYTNTLDNPPGSGAIVYSSDNPAVATVNAATGKVTAVSVGEATIKGTIAEDNDYSSSMAVYGVSVVKGLIFTDANGKEITEINEQLLPNGGRSIDVFVKNPITSAYNYRKSGEDVFTSAQIDTHAIRISVSGAKYGKGAITVQNIKAVIPDVVVAEGTLPITVSEMKLADAVIPKPVIAPLSKTTFTVGETATLQLVNPPTQDNGGRVLARAWALVDTAGTLTPLGPITEADDCFNGPSLKCTLENTPTGTYNIVAYARSFDMTDRNLYVRSDPIKITFVEPLKIVDTAGNKITSVDAFVGDEPFTLTASGGTGSGAFIYSSSDKNVATVDANTGLVTPSNRVGSTKITAQRQGTTETISYDVNVARYSGARASLPQDVFTFGSDTYKSALSYSDGQSYFAIEKSASQLYLVGSGIVKKLALGSDNTFAIKATYTPSFTNIYGSLLNGGYLYLTGIPGAPSQIRVFDTQSSGSIMSPVAAFELGGSSPQTQAHFFNGKLYVGGLSESIFEVDLSSGVSSPLITKLPIISAELRYFGDDGEYLYIGSANASNGDESVDGTHELQIWDVQDPSGSRMIGRIYDTRGAFGINKGFLYTWNNRFNNQLFVYDVSNPSKPIQAANLEGLWYLNFTQNVFTGQNGRKSFLRNHDLFGIDNTTGAIRKVSFADPLTPVLSASYSVTANTLAVEKENIYVLDEANVFSVIPDSTMTMTPKFNRVSAGSKLNYHVVWEQNNNENHDVKCFVSGGTCTVAASAQGHSAEIVWTLPTVNTSTNLKGNYEILVAAGNATFLLVDHDWVQVAP